MHQLDNENDLWPKNATVNGKACRFVLQLSTSLPLSVLLVPQTGVEDWSREWQIGEHASPGGDEDIPAIDGKSVNCRKVPFMTNIVAFPGRRTTGG